MEPQAQFSGSARPSVARWRHEGPHRLAVGDPFQATVLCAIQGTRKGAEFLSGDRQAAAGPEHVCLVPPGRDGIFRCSGAMSYVRLCFPAPCVRTCIVVDPLCREDGTLTRICAGIADALDERHDLEPCELPAWLTILDCHLSRHYGDRRHEDTEMPEKSRLAATIAYIENNLKDTLKVPELARLAGLSPSKFAAKFKQLTGMPPHRFVRSRRLNHVRDRLADANVPLADIAYEAGFSSQSHMTRAFGQAFGLTPAAYRRDLQR